MFFRYLGLFWWFNWLEIGSLWKYEHFKLIIALYYSLNITIYAYQWMKRPLLVWILMIFWPFMASWMTHSELQVTCHESQVPAMSLMFFRSLTQIYSWLMIWVPEPVGHILTGQMQVQVRSTHGLTWTYINCNSLRFSKCLTCIYSWLIIWIFETIDHLLTG